jgi:N-acetylmuramoyl-L-alanine amidase
MKSAALALLLVVGLAAAVSAPAGSLDRFSINGHEYVRLADWGRLNGLELSWASRLEPRLTGGNTRLGFTVNTQKITANGVNVWISAPVALHNGAPCVALVDVQATLESLLSPVHRTARPSLICLDPGHGGRDTGNREGSRSEKDCTLSLARELAAQLRKAGFKVYLTRSWDTYVELDERIDTARRRGADLFISLHFNAAPASEVRGSEVYCLTPPHTASTNARGEGAHTGALPGNLQNDANLQLAWQIQRALISRMGLEDRGVRRARWAVLRPARMPAVLVEGGFMSNPTESRNIASSAWRSQLATAIVEGVCSYAKRMAPQKKAR